MSRRGMHICSFILAPVLFLLPFVSHSLLTENYTLITNAEPVYYLPLFLCLAYLFYLLMHTGKHLNIPGYRRLYPLPVILFMIILMVPYREEAAAVSQIHVLLGVLVFVLLNRIMFELFSYDAKYRNAYLFMTMAAMGVSVSFMSVNGLAEVIYALGLIIILTLKNQ